MSDNTSVASPIATSNWGATFEHEVAAVYLADILLGNVPMGFREGTAMKVQLQAGWTGAALEDMIVHTANPEQILYLQIKRDLEFSLGNPKFLRVIGDCWKTFSKPQFDPKAEYYGIGLEVYQRDFDMHLYPVLKMAREAETATDFFKKICTPGYVSAEKKAFVELFQDALKKEAQRAITNDELWKFLKNFKVLYFDLKPDSMYRRLTITLLRKITLNGTHQEATALFAILKDLVTHSEAASGFFTLEKLRAEIPFGIIKTDYVATFDVDAYHSRLRGYLKAMSDYRNLPHDLDGKPLSQYYVENDAVIEERYRWEDSGNSNSISTTWKVADFLQSNDWLVLIGAAFGIGKTSMMRMITARQARSYLDEGEGFIPILAYLRDRLTNVYGQEDLNYVLSNIVAPPEMARQTRILLILDGLDEYGESAPELLHLINQLHEDYPLMKIIVTSRMKPGYQDLLGIRYFIRLLPFKPKQVNDFFKKYGVSLNYDELDSYGLREEEKQKPLFCWMMAVISSNMKSLTKMTNDWTPNMRKALIYQEFIHSLLHGKYKEDARKSESDYSSKYVREKKILRKISAIKQMHSGDLTEDELRRDLAHFGIVDWKSEVEPILTSYFSYRNDGMKRMVDFIHESFKEYLVAEYYLESLLEKKFYRLYIGYPSAETLQFLEGLLGIFKTDKVDSTGNDAMEMFHRSFSFESNGIYTPLASSTQMLNTISQPSTQCFEQLDLTTRSTASQSELWFISPYSDFIRPTEGQNYKSLWLHRWIALFVTSRIGIEMDRSQIIDLIRMSSEKMPAQLKDFRSLPFSKINLSYSNLAGANFELGNLFEAHLVGCNLTSSNLKGARLSGAALSGANLESSNCEGAIFAGAKMVGCKLSDAKFDGANLTNAVLDAASLSAGFEVEHGKLVWTGKGIRPTLKRAILNRCKIRSADIGWLDLSDCKMSEIDLSASRLVAVKLANADISRGKLEGTIVFHCEMPQADLSGASLIGSVIYESDLRGCNMSKTVLSGAYLEKVDLRGTDLRGADLRGCYLGHIKSSEIEVDDRTRTEGTVLHSKKEFGKLDSRLAQLIQEQNNKLTYGTSSERTRAATMMFSNTRSLDAEDVLSEYFERRK